MRLINITNNSQNCIINDEKRRYEIMKYKKTQSPWVCVVGEGGVNTCL